VQKIQWTTASRDNIENGRSSRKWQASLDCSSSNGEITHRAHLAVGSAFFAPAVVRSGEEVAWIIQSWRGSPAVQGAEVLLGKTVTGQCFKVYELSNKVLFTEPVMLACVRKGCVNWVRLNNLVL